MCYWCGMLTHNNKDWEIWLKSKGTLLVDNQQFGQWLGASQFSSSRKQTIKVKGYDVKKTASFCKSTRARPRLVIQELGGGEGGQRAAGKACSNNGGWNEEW